MNTGQSHRRNSELNWKWKNEDHWYGKGIMLKLPMRLEMHWYTKLWAILFKNALEISSATICDSTCSSKVFCHKEIRCRFLLLQVLQAWTVDIFFQYITQTVSNWNKAIVREKRFRTFFGQILTMFSNVKRILNLTSDIAYATELLDGGEIVADGFSVKLVEKSFANTSAFSFKVVTKTSCVIRKLKLVSEKFWKIFYVSDQKDLISYLIVKF